MAEITLETLKGHVTGYLDDTEAARQNAERRRDYVNNHQWTQEEASTLKARKQPAAVHNRISAKVDGLKGLLIQRRSDPKAYPRTQAHEEAAVAVTDGLRYVADNTSFDDTKLDVADDFFVEGFGGAVIRIRGSEDDPVIAIERVPWDRCYYDPHSRDHDFKDAGYMGILVWMDLEDAERDFGDIVNFNDSGDGGTTFDDRPKWVDTTGDRERIRIAEEYTLIDNVWHVSVFTMGGFISEPQPVPFEDEDGPVNPMELVACNIDRDNQRFGDVEYWMDAQDAINHGLSKYRHLMATRQLLIRKGAVGNVDALKREFRKPDGIMEFEGEKGDIEVVETGDMARAQLEMMQFSSSFIDSVGFNAQLAGERQGNLSGKAIDLLTNQGTNELASSFSRLTSWENRVYRQVWARIKQFWTAEKWVRVTDDERNLRWVGFNTQITLKQKLEEFIQDESKPAPQRQQAAQVFAQMQQAQDPRLGQFVEMRNDVAELDMDIILEQRLDTINIQQEQFTLLAQLAGNRPEIPFTSILKLSELRDKDSLIEKIEQSEQNAGKLIERQVEMEIAKAQKLAEIETQSEMKKIEAETAKALMVGKQSVTSEQQIAVAKIQAEQQKAIISKDITTHASTVPQKQVLEIPQADALKAGMAAVAQSNQNVASSNEADEQAVRDLIEELQRPLTIERDADGKAVALV